jgi:MraZ protein
MFNGESNHSVDTKGRLIIPTRFRDELGDEFKVTRGLDGCLFVFPIGEWQAFEEKLRALPLTQSNARRFTRFFVAGAQTCELDRQGRVLLPATLREFAGLEKDVVVTGMINRVEIWDKARWSQYNAEGDMDSIAEQMAQLGLNI